MNTINRHLGDGAGIKAVPDKERLHIFTTRSKYETVLAQLDKFVSKIRHSTIPMSGLGSKRLSKEDLRQLSILTTTWLEYGAGSKAVRLRVLVIRDLAPSS
jgi:hypothetical protein